jgi:hypothetical protein
MLSFSNRVSSVATLITFATLLGGCVTGVESALVVEIC